MTHLYSQTYAGQGYFLGLALAFVVLEALYMIAVQKRRYDFGQTLASFGVALGSIVTRPLMSLVFLMVFPLVAQFAPWRLPAGNPLVWAAGFLAFEFLYYWMHRLSHTVRWMWASHAVHHSADVFTLPAAIRLGWTNVLSGEWLAYLPLALLGFPPVMIVTFLGLDLTYQFFLHTELSPGWGVLEHVLNTPSHHRIHHASNDAYLDKNFGGVLIIFDKWFGTFATDDHHEPVRFGLTTPIGSLNPFVICLREWRNMGRDALKARSLPQLADTLFGRPK